MPRISRHGICGWRDFQIVIEIPWPPPQWPEDGMRSHPGRPGVLQERLTRQPVSLPFDPLDEFENVQQAVDRRCIWHQNTWTAADSIRGRRREWIPWRDIRSTLAPRISCMRCCNATKSNRVKPRGRARSKKHIRTSEASRASSRATEPNRNSAPTPASRKLRLVLLQQSNDLIAFHLPGPA